MATAKTGYNQTDLNLDLAEERGIVHRDYLAHCLRWTHVLKYAKMGQQVLDVGCGPQTPLAWTLYTNKFKPECYIGFDIRPQSKEFDFNFPAHYMRGDILDPNLWYAAQDTFGEHAPDIVTSFEVLEHMKHDKGRQVLDRIHEISDEYTHIFISTPNYNGKDAAGNHTHSDGTVMEWPYEELEDAILSAGFKIRAVHGTFASQSDLKPVLSESQGEKWLFELLKEYYDSNLLAILFAPLHPRESRNCIWRLSIA